MADFDTMTFSTDYVNSTNGYDQINGSSQHSRQSSQSSGLSSGNKENVLHRKGSAGSSSNSTSEFSGAKELILQKGGELLEESRTDSAYENVTSPHNGTKSANDSGVTSYSGGTAKAKAAKSPYGAGPISAIPEEEITIPNDGNISGFTCDQLANFLRCLKVDDRIISHLHRKTVDGKRFSRLKDSELEALGMNKNPVVLFFKEKSTVKKGKSNKGHFML